MLAFNHIRQFFAILSIVLLLPTGLLEARTKKGDKILKLAQAAELAKEYEKALDLYTQAMSQDPTDPSYELGLRRVRFQVGMLHVEAGQKLRKDGKLEDALLEFQKGFGADPSSAIALQEMRHTTEMIEQIRKGTATGDRPMTPMEHAQQQSQDRIESLMPVPELKPITNQINTLKMNNQPPKVLYETVGKLAGINVIFDPQYQSTTRNINLDLTNTSLEEALNYIALLTKTFWKPISANAIFVTDDNVTKRRDYEDEVAKVFYLKNVTSVQEFQEVVTAIRSVTDIRRMFTYNAQNAVVARGTVDQINLAEKLFHDLDKPKSEVVIDVVVLEVNSDRTKNIAAGLTSGGQTGLVIPVGFTPRSGLSVGGTTTSTTGTGTGTGTTATGTANAVTTTPTTGTSATISASQIGKVNLSDFSLTLPGALLQAVLSDSATKIMQSPELRASDGMKVSLKIGEKVPYASGSFQPGVGSVGVSPLVSTQFQFAETGVNVELTPHIHGTDEISMHIVVDVSNVSRTVTIGGIDQPVISQRKNEADIRIRDGEVSLLGGLINNQDTKSFSGIPGFTNVPVLGKFLLGSNSSDKTRSNLLIALIPHVVRGPGVDASDMRGVATGPDQGVKLNYAPKEPTPAPTPAAPAPGAAAAAAPPANVPVTPPTPSPAATASPTGAPAVGVPPTPPPSVPAAPPSMNLFPGDAQIALSAPVNLMLMVQNVTDLQSAPVRIKWDPKILRLNDVKSGSLFAPGGAGANPTVDIRNDAGEATIGIARTTGAATINGTGPILQFNFVAVGKGTAKVQIVEATLQNSKSEPIRVAPVSVPVIVQ
jgi:general secretion pathway protein D